ncbi:MAG: hypothetical protein KJ069_09480 [Anaerolineae bacterium]|nr:hypothetical protein [Anaerolineae bacterium]
MQGSNKFLFGIVFGVVLLVIVAFSVVLLRPEPTYQDDSTPEGAAHNYLLALQQGDFERAYQYLPTTFKYPTDADNLADDARQNSWLFETGGDYALAVDSVKQQNEEEAIVTIRKTTFYNDGLFGSRELSQTFTMHLTPEAGEWKVSEADMYWSNCWGTSQEYWCR